ncbi:hypothetical protein [Romboutsia sp.]|uniref:hypothetical protein n=1 Tax=Romboutsia sp. TaxID=1965302 RepID=UPI002CDE9960|nr:hypothetical protein [Romboutsia sp.]HSQ90314.1 hypothetical protein [Romboutsia sp.]
MGEYEIITSLAKDFMDKGDSPYWATRNALVEYRIALKDALEYEYNDKNKSKVSKITYSKNSKHTNKMHFENYKYNIHIESYKGYDKEKKIVRDLASIMNVDGFVEGKELLDYIKDAINIERYASIWTGIIEETQIPIGRKRIEPRVYKIYDFLSIEIDRVKINLMKEGRLC